MNLSTNLFFTHGIDKLCTICQVILNDADGTHSIFSTVEELESPGPMNVLQVLQSFSNFNFYNGPQMVCKCCYDKTVEVYKFIRMCNKADEIMQHYLKDVEAMKAIKDEMNVDVKVEEISIEREFIEETENENICNFHEVGMVNSGTQIKIEDETDDDVKFEEIFIAPTRFGGPEFVEEMENEKISKFYTSNNEESTISHTEILTVGNTDRSNFDNLRVEIIDEQMHDEQMGLNKCKDCDLVFSDNKELDDCGKVFASTSRLNNTDSHVHTGEKPFTCLTCKREFTSPSSLRRHMDSNNCVKAHKCEQCDRRFTQAVHLRTHMDRHNGLKAHKCEQCDRRFTVASDLRRHMLIHSGVKAHKCEQCDRRFTHVANLRSHMDIHKGVAHKCEQCDRRFTHVANLRTHMDRHNGEKAHKCEQCDQRFVQASDLRRHMLIHSGLKPHKCEQCDRQFTQAGSLRTHMLMHSGVKEHKCEQCDQQFTQAGSLRTHMLIHSGVKAHKCELCDRRFTLAAHLHSHMDDVHNGVKAHKCEQCDRRFTRASNLTRHMMIHN